MQKDQLKQVYEMVDSIPFSRAKKNINRDFSDAVMMAELIYHYFPKIVELHNYPPANSHTQKVQNWNILNNKVLKKLGFNLTKNQMQDIAAAVPGLVQELLYQILLKFEKTEQEGSLGENSQSINQNKEKRSLKNISQGQRVPKSNEQNVSQKDEVKRTINAQAEQILKLVSKIDQSNNQLTKLQRINKQKDEIIKNLQKQLQKIIFS